MASELVSVTIADGKYTIREKAPYKWECLRYGENWPAFDNNGPDNLHIALAHEVDRLRKEANTRPAPAATDTGLVTVKWPYQKTFNAIGAAVKIQGDAKAISVLAFIEAFGDELVTRSQAEELLAAKDARINALSNEVVLGFYEEEYPMYAQGYNGAGGCELCDPITAQEANGLVDKIKALEAKLETYHEEYENRKEGYEKTIDSLEEKLAAAEEALEARETIISKLVKHVYALPDDAEFTGSAATWASRLALMLGEARAVLGGKSDE